MTKFKIAIFKKRLFSDFFNLIKNKGLSIYQLSFILIISSSIFSIIIIFSAWFISENIRFQKEISQLKTNALERQKVKLKEEVLHLISYIKFIQKDTLQYSEEQLKDKVLLYFESIRFGNDGYVFVNTYSGDALLFSGKKLDKPIKMSELENPSGINLFETEMNLVKLPEGGSFQYKFYKINDSIPYPKISYIMGFNQWEWILGAGDYLDNLDSEIDIVEKELKNKLNKDLLKGIGIFIAILILLLFFSADLSKFIQNQFRKFVQIIKNPVSISNNQTPFNNIYIRELKSIGNDILQSEVLVKQFGNIIEQSINEIYIFCKKDLKFIHANKGATQNCGYSLGELQVMTFPDILTNINSNEFITLAKPLDNKISEKVQFESIYKRKDNTVYSIDVQLTLSNFNEKEVYIAFIYDITKQKNIEEKIRESEKRHRLLFENTLDGMAYHQLIFENDTAVDFFYTQVNKAFETQTGLKEVVGKKVSELVPNIHQTNPELLERFAQVAKTGKPMQYETYIKQSKIWYFTSLYALSDNIVVSVFKNITDAKLMEIELKESEELLRLSSELAHVAAWEYNFETDEMSRSKNHDSLYGLPIQEKWEFATFTNATHPADREMSVLTIQNAVAVGGPDEYKFDFRVIYPDKTIHWLNVIGKVIKRNQEGQGVLVRGFLIDITDRKIIEEALKESENRFITFMNNTSSLTWIKDENLNYVFLNKAFEKQQNIKLEFIKGKDDFVIFDKNTAENLRKNDFYVLETKQVLNTEEIVYDDKGNIFYSMVNKFPIQTASNQIYVGGIANDFTERKLAVETLRQSEIHFRQLFENNPQIMWIYDLESLQFKDVNETAILKYGYSKEEFLSMTIKDIRPLEEVSLLLNNITESEEEFQESGIWRHQLKDGTIIFVDIFSHNLNFDQKPSRLVLVNDVTKRHQTEKELYNYRNHLEELIKERTKELQQSEVALLNLVDDLNLKQNQLEISNQKLAEINTEMETFSYSVSHDLKAPLRGIDGYSNLLQELYVSELNEEAKSFIKNIRYGTQQMNQIIDDLLAYSKLDRSLINKYSINIHQFVNHIIRLYQKELSDDHFVIENQLPNTNIVADVDALSIAFRNIFENAIKFTKLVENPKITILLEENQKNWNLLIRDNGIGFDMKYYDKIFQIFQRLHRIEEYPGTGIGLAMVQKAIQRMGGRVYANSELGKGATFYIEIPKIKI